MGKRQSAEFDPQKADFYGGPGENKRAWKPKDRREKIKIMSGWTRFPHTLSFSWIFSPTGR